MATYARKKSLVEAEQLTPELALAAMQGKGRGPLGMTVSGSYNSNDNRLYGAYVYFSHLAGMRAELGDYVVKINDQLVPMKKADFEKEFEAYGQ